MCLTSHKECLQRVGTEPESPGVGPSCHADSRPPCVGRWEAESRRTRPHAFLMGPNYSNSCAEESRPERLWKRAALGTLPHPRNSGCSPEPLGWIYSGGRGEEEPARHGCPPHLHPALGFHASPVGPLRHVQLRVLRVGGPEEGIPRPGQTPVRLPAPEDAFRGSLPKVGCQRETPPFGRLPRVGRGHWRSTRPLGQSRLLPRALVVHPSPRSTPSPSAGQREASASPPAAPVLRTTPAAAGPSQFSDKRTSWDAAGGGTTTHECAQAQTKILCGGDLPSGRSMTSHRRPLWAAPASGGVRGP